MIETEKIKTVGFDVNSIRKDFPILKRKINGKPLVYFDSGATAQKPQVVIDSIVKFYSEQNANIHRGVHTLSRECTTLYENARETVQAHINAKLSSEIIFTRGTTESINLVADCLNQFYLKAGDEVIVSEMEHHSNFLPWQQLRERFGIILKTAPVNENGQLKIDQLDSLFTAKTKLLALTHVSNTMGTINPVKEIIKKAHAKNCAVLIDGAQALPHFKIDVQDLDADFYVFSGHKVYAPTGIGVLYAKKEWLDKFPVYQSGGGTIKTVALEKTEYAEAPLKFEAGTPNIEGAIALATALNYINEIGLENIQRHENELLNYATEKLKAIEGIKFIGGESTQSKAGVLSFLLEGTHPFDVGTILDKLGIAVRTGHHCTQPLMNCLGIPGTIRVSFAVFNTKEEIDLLVEGVIKAKKMLL
jgi:cysteine desulfurase / selenocysteine lyase